MKLARIILTAAGVAAVYFVGYSTGRGASSTTQAAAAEVQKGAPTVERPGWAPVAPDQPAREQLWRIDDLRKLHEQRVAAALANRPEPSLDFLLTRTHTVRLITRLGHQKPVPSNITKRVSLWDDAEQHQGVSDIYVIVGGGGTMVIGGEIDNRQYRPTEGPRPVLLLGEFVGQPIVGGRTYKVKAGDIINIPPDTAHQAQPDAGGMTYFMIKVNVGLYPWPLTR